MPSSSQIIIDVRNFGPIRSGRFDIRPLTVFTGKNNTGKSCLASIVYALFSYPSSTKFRTHLYEVRREVDKIGRMRKFMQDPVFWINNLKKHGSIELNNEEVKTVSTILDFDRQAGLIAEEIYRCSRAVEPISTIRGNANSEASIRVIKTERNSEKTLSTDCFIDVDKVTAKLRVPVQERIFVDDLEKRYLLDIARHVQRFGRNANDGGSLTFSFNEVFNLINKKFLFATKNVLYLPAERIGLTNNYRTFVSSILQENANHNTLQASGINLDFIKKLLDIPKNGNELDISSESSQLEKKILQGKIEVVHDSFGMPHFFYSSRSSDKKIPLNISSSMVSQIAPVVLFLRYYRKSHRIFIIEEPEAHLHPENQVKFIQEICSWVRRGYHVILTTHSEWIMEELSNQVLAYDVGLSDSLEPKKVGVWEVQGSRNGSTVREIKWKPDESGYDDGFDRVADRLSNKWFELHGRL